MKQKTCIKVNEVLYRKKCLKILCFYKKGRYLKSYLQATFYEKKPLGNVSIKVNMGLPEKQI